MVEKRQTLDEEVSPKRSALRVANETEGVVERATRVADSKTPGGRRKETGERV